MFRLQDNTPSVYVEQSRDFQLFCRLYDCINNGVKFDIDSIINILDPKLVNDRILTLLATRVGFFPKREYDSNILRYIIASFSYALKYKGTKRGIEIAVSTILKAEKSIITDRDIETTIQIDNINHSIWIYTTGSIINIHALEDFLSYILPVGYTHQFGVYDPREYDQEINTEDSLAIMVNPMISNSQVRGTDRYLDINSSNEYQFKTEEENETVGTYTATFVIGSNDYLTKEPFGKDINGTVRDSIDKSLLQNPDENTVHIFNIDEGD